MSSEFIRMQRNAGESAFIPKSPTFRLATAAMYDGRLTLPVRVTGIQVSPQPAHVGANQNSSFIMDFELLGSVAADLKQTYPQFGFNCIGISFPGDALDTSSDLGKLITLAQKVKPGEEVLLDIDFVEDDSEILYMWSGLTRQIGAA